MAAELIKIAMNDPDGATTLAALLAAGQQVYEDPESSWDPVDLEAMALARVDAPTAAAAHEAVHERAANVAAVVNALRSAGAVDAPVSDESLVHLTLALSAGMALIAPVLDTEVTPAEWSGILTRISLAMAPPDLDLAAAPSQAVVAWWLRLDIPVEHGSSARLLRALGALGCSTTFVQALDADEHWRTVEIGIRAPESVTREMLVGAASVAARAVRVTQGTPIDGRDVVARLLDGATYLLRHPETAPEFAATMLGAEEVEVVDATEGESDSTDVLRLQWTTHRHVLLRRRWASFTHTERARASALLRLAATAAQLPGDDQGRAHGWIETIKGGTVWIRLARPEDAGSVADMHERISERSRYQRYFATTAWRELQMQRLSGGHPGDTLVAQSIDGQVVALGNVFPLTEGSSAAEVALLVEDAFQGRGLGGALLDRMIQVAAELGFTEVVADVLVDNRGMQHLLEATGLPWFSQSSNGVRTMRARLPSGRGE